MTEDHECFTCQLEKEGKAFARIGFEKDLCGKHKKKCESRCNPLDHIDDGIDLNKEHDLIHREHHEKDIRDYPKERRGMHGN
jgi:hypothetical protein